ncbi:MAG: enoyl-CoA hydratase/isomerase family protein [Chloroflexi bacterium]|nr:enoyl-CoA hydratase/isomerase family protein [Chloroflexota bacterium]MCI0890627.1 enoyl-CoA hydratase/isomerase family protein [Chloroflexota bacterium]
MSDSQYEHILYEKKGRIAVITLNRPKKLNAWTPLMEAEFIDAVNKTASDDDLSVLLVTGEGRGFCAGADIGGWAQDMATREERPPTSPLLARDGSPEVPIALSRGKPAIAAINGPAIGIGLTMTLACDIRLASDRATFSARFVKIGLTPECGSTRYLPLVAGFSNALFLALTGRIIDAQEAKERGLVDRIVPHESLIDEAMALAEEIAANPTDAIWGAKRLIHEAAVENDLRRVVTQEVNMIREQRRLPAHAEAVSAFQEKREPRFHG